MIEPKFNRLNLSQGSFFQIYDNEDFILDGVFIEDEIIERQHIEHPIIEKCLFEKVVFEENELNRPRNN